MTAWARGSHWTPSSRNEVRRQGLLLRWEWRTVVTAGAGTIASDCGWALTRSGADMKAARAMVRLQRELTAAGAS